MRAFVVMVAVACVAGLGVPPVVGAEASTGRWGRRDRASTLIAAGVPRSGDGASYSASASTSYRGTVRDFVGDVGNARGDIVRSNVIYEAGMVTLRMKLRNAGSYKTRSWQRGDTAMVFWLDTNGDDYDDYSALIFNNGSDRLVAITFAGSSGTCQLLPRKQGDVFTLRFRPRCIGEPSRLRFQAWMFYDRDVAEDTAKSLQVDLAPEGWDWSAWIRRQPRPTSTVITSAPARASYGEAVLINATATSRYPFFYSSDLGLYRRYRGTRRWERVTTQETDWEGMVYFRREVSRPVEFQVRYPGSVNFQPSRSRVAFVDVGMAVSHSSVPDHQPLGSTIQVQGRVRPAHPNARIALQRRTSTGWQDVASGRVTKRSRYALSTTPERSQRYTYRVRVAGDGLRSPGITEDLPVDIYRAKIAGVEPSDPVSETENLNSEWITVRNNGGTPINLSSWGVAADVQPVYISHTVSDFAKLQPGEQVRVHTGEGTHRAGHLYLNRTSPLWPAAGVARLYNDTGTLMDDLIYGPE
jgi:hypothetical protein